MADTSFVAVQVCDATKAQDMFCNWAHKNIFKRLQLQVYMP